MSQSVSSMQLALMMAGVTLALATDVPALPALHCPPDTTADQCSEHSSTNFSVNGFAVEFTYEVNKTLRLKCNNDLLDASQTLRWLPRFTPALHVGEVSMIECPPARYVTVLAALNITLTSPFNLELHNVTHNEPLLAEHFANLPPLRHLTLQNAGVLHGLPASLERLTMKKTSLANDTTLELLPHTLTELRLETEKIILVPAAVLDLPELRSLYLDFLNYGGVVERSNKSRLQQLYVYHADGALMSKWAPPALEEVTLEYWRAVKPNPIPACDKLVKLTLLYPDVRELPDGWVARCPRLKELIIECAFCLLGLPARLLNKATQLTHLRIFYTYMSTLPAQLFADTPHLTHLNLSYNQFKQLPSSMLTLSLVSLDLGGNSLNTSVVAELANFTELRSLSLASNQELGNLCGINNVPEHNKMKSSLALLSKLELLDLYRTGISVICSDWREDMVNLKYLDLGDTKLGNLTYEDLHYKRIVPAVVKLAGTIYFTADDYDRAAAAAAVAPPSRYVTVISFLKTIDCSLYWITEALNDLLCPSKETCATVSSVCYCGMAGGGLLRVICVGNKHIHVPQLPSLTADFNAIDLVLSNNSITELVVDDLPPHLRVIDLRNNSISYMTETTARALVSGTKRRVLLAGNRLECSCRATPALRVLRDHAAVLGGYDTLRCEDGRTFEDVIDGCWTLTTIFITALLPTVAAVTLALCLRWKWRYVLGHSRALLWRLGWRFRDAPPAAWWSDAFVMFGRGDERPALEVTARLEHGPRPRRVCLAERDWLPPALLSDCITLSARTARYTVALISRECEPSLELDEIHAVARRGALVMVLPPAGELEDAALRRYATDYPHMVLRRDAPDFWRRLERVVPPTPASPPTPPSEDIQLVPLTPHR